MEILKPYRRKIDELDAQIIDMLRRRYGVIREVGHLKAKHGIPATIPERVEEVQQHALRHAREKGLDEDFIGRLYKQLIQHSCDLEETIILEVSRRKKSAAT